MEKQRTIEKEFSLRGKGLQTGKPVKVFFYPEKEDKSIIFTRRDLKETPSVSLKDLSNLYAQKRRTKIGLAGGACVETVEHLLAALWGAGVDNIRIDMDSSEPPALGGGSLEFLEALKNAGIVEQDSPRKYIRSTEPVWVEENESFLGVFPSDIFKITCLMEKKEAGMERQFFSQVLNRDIFAIEIAPARTSWFLPAAIPRHPALVKICASFARTAGYGRGANMDNVLILSKGRAVNRTRFPDEAVRHKVLDLIGDLYLLARPLKARVIGIRNSHKLNLELVKKIKKLQRNLG